VDSISKESETFHTELKMKGIVDVRVVPETSRGANVGASNSSISTTGTISSTHTIMAVVLSAAGVTLLVGIILRRGSIRRNHFGYAPTLEETYDNQCLGIQSLERMENSSDQGTHHTLRSPNPTVASF
jgi:hypothetical protein